MKKIFLGILCFCYSYSFAQSVNVTVYSADQKTSNSHLRKYVEIIYLFSDVVKKVNSFNVVHYNNSEISSVDWTDEKKKKVSYNRQLLPCDFNYYSKLDAFFDEIPSNHKVFLLAKNDILNNYSFEGISTVSIESKSTEDIQILISEITKKNKKANIDILIIHSGNNFTAPSFNFKQNSILTNGIVKLDIESSIQNGTVMLNVNDKEVEYKSFDISLKVNKDELITGYIVDDRGCKSNQDEIEIDFEAQCDCDEFYGSPELMVDFTRNISPLGSRRANWDFQISPAGGSGQYSYELAIKNVCAESYYFEVFDSQNNKVNSFTKPIEKLKEDMVKRGLSQEQDYFIVKISMVEQIELINNPKEYFTVKVIPVLKNKMNCPSRMYSSKKIRFSSCETDEE
jgi:hypothetical protein